MIARLLVVAALLAAPAATQAQPATQVTVANAWSRATPPGASTGAAYLTLTSPVDDTLTAVSSPAAKVAQVHEMTMDGAVMRMREVAGGLALPAGKPVTLAPNGLHVMLVGLNAPLKAGQTITLHLSFAKAPSQDVVAKVGPLGSTHPPGQAAAAPMPGMAMH